MHKHLSVLFVLLVGALSLVGCRPKAVCVDYVDGMTLQDYYKRGYQAFYGAEHMVPDTASVLSYLHYELSLDDYDEMSIPLYEDIGDYCRVSLEVVRRGELTAEQLAYAFIESARTVAREEGEWPARWQAIQAAALEAHPELADDTLQADLQQAALLNAAVRHSELYRATHHPHYRIIRKDVLQQLGIILR